MTKDKKLAVLEALQKLESPASLKELQEQLDFPERSLRRWLSELAFEGLVEKIGQKKGTLYQKTVSEPKLDPLQYIDQPLFKRKPVTYREEWLENYLPNKTPYLSDLLKSKLHQAGKRSNEDDPAGTYARHIFNRLLIDLSYNSSRLEGNTYSLLDTERLLVDGQGAEGKLEEEKVMILNHKEAIRYLVDNAEAIEAKKQVVCTLHYLLADGLVPDKYAGKIRQEGVKINGSVYVPFENPARLEKQLNLICKKALLIEDPFEQSLFLLAHLSYLQAFFDVNKRTARLSANIPLVKNNLVPLSFNGVERKNYTSALLAIYELNEIGPLIDIFVDSYLRTCLEYNATVESIAFDRLRVLYRKQRREALRHILLKKLIGKPLDKYIQTEAKQIKAEDRPSFIEDIYEDLKYMGPERIAGLGVTLEEMQAWVQIYQPK